MPNSYSWYTNKTSLQSPDTIHQILAFGTFDVIKVLRKTVGEEFMRNLFVSYSKKIYIAAGLNFIKKFILHVTSPVDDQKYLKSSPRNT